MEKYILECCVDSVESAIEAEKGGANRLELCANLIIGGTSPSLALFKKVKEKINIKINVLLRPRFGDFLYSDYEFEILKEEVKQFKEAGADGVVIGCLRSDGTIDSSKMEELIALAEGMHITMHRAFDMTENPYEALREAKRLGVNTILTSGQRNTALEGKELIKALIEEAGDDLEILVGSGVNAEVIKEFIYESNAWAFHMSGKETLISKMDYKNSKVSMGLPMMSEYEIWKTDYKKVQAAKAVIDKVINM
ncbi:copper homeostasis protein CutC [Clostridium culturomicium]|uniref:copper homeostasis protein CutC n=1 Tax=Clostridium culturomicium TaxID=1499683 RepID=UPI00058AF45C|nr:copper homeostasis protein CutC [Clostridium culturomicium]